MFIVLIMDKSLSRCGRLLSIIFGGVVRMDSDSSIMQILFLTCRLLLRSIILRIVLPRGGITYDIFLNHYTKVSLKMG